MDFHLQIYEPHCATQREIYAQVERGDSKVQLLAYIGK